jgi:hypothetical protein
MMDFVRFIAQDREHFAGFVIAVVVVAWALGYVIAVIRGAPADL